MSPQLISEHNYYLHRSKDAEKDLSYISDYINFDNKYVLEIGCGSGAKSVFFGRLASFAIGIDISEKVKLAPLLVDRNGNSDVNVRFSRADAMALPFQSHSFDIVLLHDTMEHIPNPELVIQEASRVLKKGGTISIIMPHYYGLSGSHLWNYFSSSIWRYLHLHILIPGFLLRPMIGLIGKKRSYTTGQINWEWNQFRTLNKLRTGYLKQILEENHFDLEYVHLRRGRLPVQSLWSSPLVEELFSWGIVIVARKK
ncbi:MAG: class I SAM-dependent methyltransferase [Chitinophagaceae bacterium]